MVRGESPSPRRAKMSWIQWLNQPFTEDPAEDDDDYCGDRNGEPSEDYDLGCLILAGLFGVSMGAVCMLLLLLLLE